MKERIISDLNSERDSILNQLKEKKGQEAELDKVLVATRKDISLLEGRLMEVKAILEYVDTLGTDEEPQVAPEVESLEN
jgi:hypothetical protein